MALGANAPAVLRMVLAGGLAPAIAGLALGFLGSLALSRTLSTFLYETSAARPADLRGRPGAAAHRDHLACLAPASRAARFDPMLALRHQ